MIGPRLTPVKPFSSVIGARAESDYLEAKPGSGFYTPLGSPETFFDPTVDEVCENPPPDPTGDSFEIVDYKPLPLDERLKRNWAMNQKWAVLQALGGETGGPSRRSAAARIFLAMADVIDEKAKKL